MLDTLHEDLNRVLNKPYVELNAGSDKPDTQVAKEFWEGHLKRN